MVLHFFADEVSYACETALRKVSGSTEDIHEAAFELERRISLLGHCTNESTKTFDDLQTLVYEYLLRRRSALQSGMPPTVSEGPRMKQPRTRKPRKLKRRSLLHGYIPQLPSRMNETGALDELLRRSLDRPLPSVTANRPQMTKPKDTRMDSLAHPSSERKHFIRSLKSLLQRWKLHRHNQAADPEQAASSAVDQSQERLSVAHRGDSRPSFLSLQEGSKPFVITDNRPRQSTPPYESRHRIMPSSSVQSSVPVPFLLPHGWKRLRIADKNLLFADFNLETISWEELRRRRSSGCQICGPPLPPGWDAGVTLAGRVYYVAHESRTTTWVDPRGADNILSTPLVPGWYMRVDSNSRTHFFNIVPSTHQPTISSRPNSRAYKAHLRQFAVFLRTLIKGEAWRYPHFQSVDTSRRTTVLCLPSLNIAGTDGTLAAAFKAWLGTLIDVVQGPSGQEGTASVISRRWWSGKSRDSDVFRLLNALALFPDGVDETDLRGVFTVAKLDIEPPLGILSRLALARRESPPRETIIRPAPFVCGFMRKTSSPGARFLQSILSYFFTRISRAKPNVLSFLETWPTLLDMDLPAQGRLKLPPAYHAPEQQDLYQVLQSVAGGVVNVERSGDAPFDQTGGFADVGQGRILPGGELAAIKILRKTSRAYKLAERLAFELSIWSSLKHDNVLPLWGVSLQWGISLVSPWMSQGNVANFLKTQPHADRISLICGIKNGLHYLHGCSVVHGDLKGANILIGVNGQPHLADFGLSVILDEPEVDTPTGWYSMSSTADPASTVSTSATPSCQSSQGRSSSGQIGGSIRWMAPERLLPIRFGFTAKTSLTPASDVFSFGMTIYEILADRPPFAEMINYAAGLAIISRSRPDHPGITASGLGLTKELWLFVTQCWAEESLLRPSLSALDAVLGVHGEGRRDTFIQDEDLGIAQLYSDSA